MNDKKRLDPISRRRFLTTTASGAMLATAGTLGLPRIGRAADPVKIGVVHPVTGFLQFSGTQCRFGALTAIDEINAAGGIRSLGGAQLEAVLGDAQSKAEVGAAEVEKFNAAGVSAIVGAYASGICLATTQAAAKHGIPHVVDVGVNDKIVGRGLENTFRFGPGFGVITKSGVDSLININEASGKPAKTVVIVHENTTPFGSFMAGLMRKGLEPAGFEVLEALPHPTPNKDFRNIALKIKELNPDLVIPSHYYNEGVLFLRTLQRQRVPGSGPVRDGLQPLVRSPVAGSQSVAGENRGGREDLLVRGFSCLHGSHVHGRRHRARRFRRARRDHDSHGLQHLERPLHAVWPHPHGERSKRVGTAAGHAGAG
jgi:branched-chain amino acid transport system substrate-binding protein